MRKLNYFIVDSYPQNAVLYCDCWYSFPYRYKSICDCNGVFLGYIRERLPLKSFVWHIIEHIRTYGLCECNDAYDVTGYFDDDLPF